MNHQKKGNFNFHQIDYLELYVGNAFQAAHFYQKVLGFDIIAYKDLTMGSKDCVSYLVQQGTIRLLLTSGVNPSSPIFHHVHVHGDGVKDIAFTTSNVKEAFEMAVQLGAVPVQTPKIHQDADSQLVTAAIKTFGETIHTLLERQKGSETFFLPGYQPYHSKEEKKTGIGLKMIDHLAICVNQGEMEKWCDFYKNTLGFYTSHKEDVYTEYSGMKSEVVQLDAEGINFPIIEPASSRKRSQIAEFLDFYQGAGVQHMAFLSEDIIRSVRILKNRGIQFLNIPDAYYEDLLERVGPIEENPRDLQELGILVDRDQHGYLLQIFSKPLQSRPTLFFELIRRKGAKGFGSGNIRALYQALEKEQSQRGNL